jgi:hypothetical protein
MIRTLFFRTLIVVVTLLSVQQLSGQGTQKWKVGDSLFVQQTGFNTPSLFKEMINYRLPDWGYQAISLDGNLNGNGTMQYFDGNGETNSSYNHTLDGFIRANFTKYAESELRLFDLKSFIQFDLNSHKLKETYNRNSTKKYGLVLNGAMDYYKWKSAEDDRFTVQNVDVDIQYKPSFNSGDFNYNGDENQLDYATLDYTLKYKLGFGKGRLRNVTPVIYAIRFQERSEYAGLTSNSSLETLQSLAQQFSKLDGYTKTGYRNEKFFWNDVNRIAGIENNSSVFATNYVQESIFETIGVRKEGRRSSVKAGIEFLGNHRYILESTTTNNYNSYYREVANHSIYSINANFEAYSNKSLNTQIGHEVGFDVSFWDLSSKYSQDFIDFTITSLFYKYDYLKQLADRMVFQLSNTVTGQVAGGRYYDSTNFALMNSLNTNLYYFLEKSTVVRFNFNYMYTNIEPFEEYSLSFHAYSTSITIQHFFGSRFW